MNQKTRKFQIALSVCLLLAMVFSFHVTPAQASPDTIIDLFDDNFGTFTQTGMGTLNATDDDGSILGGERDLALNITSGGGSVNVDGNISVPGALAHSAGALVYATTEVTYDGNDSDATVLDPEGLGGLDFTTSGDNMIYVVVSTDDFAANLIIRVWTDPTTCSSMTRALPGGISSSSLPRAYIFRYTEFTTDAAAGCNTAVDFTNVGAVQFMIDGTVNDNTDVVASVIATGKVDYGDLNDSYGTILTDDGVGNFTGAGHVMGSLFLGAAVDGEDDGQPSLATDDDLNGTTPDDEDGVVRTNLPWTNGAGGGAVSVTVNGDGCLYGWVDWNKGGTFGNTATGTGVIGTADRIIAQSVSAGTSTITFNTPSNANFVSNSYFARFRLYPRDPGGSCWTGTGNYAKFPNQYQHYNGEVEDFNWGFGPTAVEISSTTARPAGGYVLPLVIGAALLAVGGVSGLIIVRRRK